MISGSKITHSFTWLVVILLQLIMTQVVTMVVSLFTLFMATYSLKSTSGVAAREA